MAYREIDVSKLIPEEFKDTPYFKDLAKVIQRSIVEPFITNLNQLMLVRQPGDDVQSETVILTQPLFNHVLKDPFEKGSLLIMERGITLFREKNPDTSDATDILVNAVTDISNGTVDHTNRTVTMSFTGASPSNPISLEIIYLTQYSMDATTLDALRQSLGLFIDTTGLTTEEDSRRLIESLPFYYENNHSKRFVQFLGYAANVLFNLEELYCRMSAYPDYGEKFTYSQMVEAGFSDWAHTIETPRACDCVVGLKQIIDLYPDGLVNDDTDSQAALSNSNRSFTFEQVGSATALTDTVWDRDAGDIVGFDCEIETYTENPSAVTDVVQLCLFVIEAGAATRKYSVGYTQGVGLEYTGEDFVTPAVETVILDASYVMRANDQLSISFNAATGSVTFGIIKDGDEPPVYYGPYTGITVAENGDYRAGVSAELGSGAHAAVNFRTNGRIADPSDPDYDTTFTLGFPFSLQHRDWCGNRIGDYGEISNSIWYKTSFISLEYDDEQFFENVPQYVNLFEKITQLFYQLAPIQLVLESIVAKRKREHRFALRSGIWMGMHQKVNTDSSTVTGVTPGPPQ